MNIDKNTVIGFILMIAVVFGFMTYQNYQMKENEKARQERAAIEAVEQKAKEAEAEKQKIAEIKEKEEQQTDTLNPLFSARKESNGFAVIENELLRLTIDDKGGKIRKVELKDSTYKSRDKKSNVVLFDNDENTFNITIDGKDFNIKSSELFFQQSKLSKNGVTMSLPLGKGSIDFIYSLVPNSYILKMDIKANNVENLFSANTSTMNIAWYQRLRQQEKGFAFENNHSTVTYREDDNDTEVLSSGGGNETETEFDRNAHWIAFKDQFFSHVIIADKPFKLDTLSSKMDVEGSGYLKYYKARFNANFDPTGTNATNLQMYLGPNKFSTLRENEKIINSDKDLDLQSLVYLGWPIVRWINRYIMVYLFDWMTNWGINMGIVLLILTVVIKLLVTPLMKKSYLSSANMRVLKPKVDEISAKYPKPDQAMMKQSETMKLYNEYGVSPMGGCLPMLIQMPIWIALFNFIPNAIELRGESFLWADDLSTYDDIIKWNFNIPLIGNHLSIFCVLWCIVTIGNTWISMRQQKYTMSEEQQKQMSMMKWFSYLMPLIFFFTFNGYSSGLNYYYFISGLISILIMWWLRKSTDDAKLLQKLEERHKKRMENPQKSSGGFMDRFQKMAELQQQMQQQQQQMQQNKKK